ncbi:MAG: carbohydrate kinase family protein [Bacteroidota bacterium]
MKILVIGHLCLDVIHPAEGPEVQSYGGIYYAVAALAALAGRGDEIVPVFGVGEEEYTALMQRLASFPNVNAAAVTRLAGPTNRVRLFYKESGERVECSHHIAPPIPYDQIRRHTGAQGILINMVSGSDIALDTLDEIRMAVRGGGAHLHLDFHSLTLGLKGNRDRFRRPVPEWRRWAFMADSVQLNEEEVAGLSPESLTEEQTAGHLLSVGVRGVLVTRGSRGATLYRSDRKRLVRADIPAPAVERPRDATGCGDVFGAAFLLQMLRHRDMPAAAAFAVTVAARKALLAGSEDLGLLAEFRRPS